MPSLSLPRAVELLIDCGAKGRRSRRCNWLRLCAAVTAAGLPLPCGDYPPYRTVPYLHCAAPSGAPTGRPGFNPADLRGVQPGFNLRGVQPAVQLVDRVDERSGFAHRRRTHLPEGRTQSDGGRDRFGGINRIHSGGRRLRTAGAIWTGCAAGLCRIPYRRVPEDHSIPRHTTAYILTAASARRADGRGRRDAAAARQPYGAALTAYSRRTHGVLTAAAVLYSTPKW